MNLPSPQDADARALAIRGVVRAFAEENPDVSIEPFVMPQIAGGGMDSGPLMAIAAGVPPHAIYVNFRQSSTYIEQGFLAPFEVLLARNLSSNPLVRQADDDGEWLADPTQSEIDAAVELIRQRVPEPAWPVVYRPGFGEADAESHVWSVPTGVTVYALMYRRDLFAEAGLDPDDPPDTWEEFLAAARALTDPDKGRFGLMIDGGQYLSWSAYALFVGNGARAMERDDATGEWSATFDSKQAAESLSFLWKLTRETFERDGEMMPPPTRVLLGNEGPLLWDRGQIGMSFGSFRQDLMARSNPQLVSFAPLPRSPRGTRGGELNANMLGVYSGASPEQQLAVARFIWFMTSDDARRQTVQSFVDNGYGGFVNPVWLEEFGHTEALRDVTPGLREVFAEGLASGVPEPYGRNTQHIYRYMSRPMQRALEMDLSNLSEEERIAAVLPLLEAGVAETNEKLLGQTSEADLQIRRVVGWVTLIVLVVVFGYVGRSIWKSFGQLAVAPAAGMGRQRWKPVLMLVPALGIMALWIYLPLAWSLGLSFTDYKLAATSEYVGVMNFSEALFDQAFWASLGRTMLFVSLVVGLGFWPPVILAILLDEVPTAWAKYLFRTLLYLPSIVSGVVVMFLWKQLYEPTPNGALNRVLLLLNDLGPVLATCVKLLLLALWGSLLTVAIVLMRQIKDVDASGKGALLSLLGITVAGTVALCFALASGGLDAVGGLVGPFALEPLRFIESPQTAMLCSTLPLIWVAAGPSCLLYLAALKTIPGDLYEAAEIDGANFSTKLLHITLPRLKLLLAIDVIAAVVGAFKGGADYLLALTGGGPNGATTVLSLEIFTRTFMDLRFGLGTAMAWLLGLLLIAVTTVQLRQIAKAQFTAG